MYNITYLINVFPHIFFVLFVRDVKLFHTAVVCAQLACAFIANTSYKSYSNNNNHSFILCTGDSVAEISWCGK